MDKIPLGRVNNIPSAFPQSAPVTQAPQGAAINFDNLLAKAQTVAFEPGQAAENPINTIPLSMIPQANTKSQVVGYKSTFLGTFSKRAEAYISRGEDGIVITSPLGNMKIIRDTTTPSMVFVELPQGKFLGKVCPQANGDLLIESDDKRKSITIHKESNGDLTVTNKGIEDNIRLVFKTP